MVLRINISTHTLKELASYLGTFMRTHSSNKRGTAVTVTNDEINHPPKRKKADVSIAEDDDIESRNSSKRIEADDADSNQEDID